MITIITMALFAGAVAAIGALLRRRERDGDFDPQTPSSAARPGVRRLFDLSAEGWRGDGVRQRPPRREDLSRS